MSAIDVWEEDPRRATIGTKLMMVEAALADARRGWAVVL